MRQAFGSAQAGCPGAHPPPSGSQLGTPLPQKLEEQDRRALSIKEQLQREHRFLKRRLEQLSAQSLERVRTDSTGSAVSTDDSEQGGPWVACWQPRGGGGACSRCGPWDGMRKLGRVPQRAKDSGGPFRGPALTRPFRSPQKWTSRAWSLAPASWTVWAAAVTWTTTTACGAAAAATAASGPPAGGPAALASRRRCPPRSSARPPTRPSVSTLRSLKPLHGPTAVPFWKLRRRPGCPPAGQGPPRRPLLPPGQGPLREAGPSSHIREPSIAAHSVFSDTQSFQKY